MCRLAIMNTDKEETFQLCSHGSGMKIKKTGPNQHNLTKSTGIVSEMLLVGHATMWRTSKTMVHTCCAHWNQWVKLDN